MSRSSWLGRATGRHAAGPRRRAGADAGDAGAGSAPRDAAQAEPRRTRAPLPTDGPHLLGAPTMTEASPAPLVSPVTDAARAAVSESAAALPAYIPPGADPMVTIDALGRKCPLPIIWLAQQIGDVPVGAVIAVLADDPAAYSDIPAWCGLKSHDCVFRADYETGWSFGIRRRY